MDLRAWGLVRIITNKEIVVEIQELKKFIFLLEKKALHQLSFHNFKWRTVCYNCFKIKGSVPTRDTATATTVTDGVDSLAPTTTLTGGVDSSLSSITTTAFTGQVNSLSSPATGLRVSHKSISQDRLTFLR